MRFQSIIQYYKFNVWIPNQEKNTPKGYLQMFSGAMRGICNPKAHTNQVISEDEAIRKSYFASLLMWKIDQALAFTHNNMDE